MSSPLIFAAGEASTTFGPLDFAIAGSLLFWGLICFLIYYFFLAPRLMTRSEAIMEDRDQTVKGDLAAAEDANAKAADLLAQYEAKLDEARSNASEAVRTVLAEADKKAIAAENRVSKKIAEAPSFSTNIKPRGDTLKDTHTPIRTSHSIMSCVECFHRSLVIHHFTLS